MILTQFDDCALPGAQSKLSLPRVAVHETINATGARGGAYDLWGSNSPMAEQSASYSFTFKGGERSAVDEIMSKVGTRAILKANMFDVTASRWDSRVPVKGYEPPMRQATAKLVSANETTLNSAESWRYMRSVDCDFRIEPYWYDDVTSVADLSSTTMALVVNNGNTPIIASIIFTIINSPAGGVLITNLTNAQTFTYNAAVAGPLVIDVGAQIVTVNGVSQYANTLRPDTQIEWMSFSPGLNVLTFSVAVDGTIEYRSCWK